MASRRATKPSKTGTVPATMRAAVIDRFGPPSRLKIRNVPVPDIGPTEVLIALHGAGVGIWDAKIRDGTWAEGTETFPLILGVDGAGYVVAKGGRVRRFEVGERVWAYQYENPKGGFYAEYVAVDAESVGSPPEHLRLLEAGAGACTGLTALQGIEDHLGVRRKETVLVFGATGAVGSLAVQFAKSRGARVIATASGAKATRFVLDLGADAAFDARKEHGVERLDSLAPDGLDAVLALAGGDALEQCLERVRSRGRIALPNGVEPEPRRRRGIQVMKYDGIAGPREWTRLLAAAKKAKLRVPIDKAYPLERAADAHERVEQGHVLGRVALRIRRGD
jgi:NADPH:quinone reductase-like Zn-dependent oxidoreductase